MNEPLIVQVIAAGIVIAVLSVVGVLAIILAGSGCIVLAARIAEKVEQFRRRYVA